MEINFINLIDVLTQGNKHIMELESRLDQPFSSEACKFLLSQVQSALATAIDMTKILEQEKLLPSAPASDSPRTYRSEITFREQERQERSKKRKTLPRWSGQVTVCSGSTMGGPMDDGHSWRKYGQKEILGAKFPRGYYRCTYRNSHGCVATKHVQRSGDDPSIFDITYRGAHTCNHGLQNIPLLPPPDQTFQQNIGTTEEFQQQHQQLLQIFKTGLTVKTEGLGSDSGNRRLENSPSFSFPWMPASCTNTGNNVVPYSPVLENYMGGCDSEISDIFSATTSTTSSPMVGTDFGWDQLFIENEIPFEFLLS